MQAYRVICLVASMCLSTFFWHPELTSAQINPSDIRQGFQSGNGEGTFAFFTVPAGSTFVLTDFTWSPLVLEGDLTSPEIILSEGGVIRHWVRDYLYNVEPGTTYLIQPLQIHWMTGLVFASGVTIDVQVSPFIPNRGWTANWSGYLVPAGTAAVGESGPAVPAVGTLSQNAPNPFTPSTEIRYTMTTAGDAHLRIYDSQGRLVRTLIQAHKEGGEHAIVWDGRNDSGQSVASGTYYYELSTKGGREARKAVLLR